MVIVARLTNAGAVGHEGHDPAALRAADWLSLAAAPAFAMMATLTGVLGPPDMLCSAAHASPLRGMVPMYLLMSVFHLAPWLRLISRRRSASASPALVLRVSRPGEPEGRRLTSH